METSTMKRDIVPFIATIAAGTLNQLLSFTVLSDATLERVTARFYPGEERTLQVIPQVKKPGGSVEPILSQVTGSTNFLAGDDDLLDFRLSLPLSQYDTLQVIASNTGDFAYDLVVYMEVDYLGGSNRVVG